MFATRPFLAAAAVILLIGCGGPKTEAEKKEAARKDPVVQALNKTGLAYAQHIDAKGQGPANWNELISYAKLAKLDVASIELIKSKGYTFKWGVKYRDVTTGVSTFVLGQPNGPGPKLMLDGTIQLE